MACARGWLPHSRGGGGLKTAGLRLISLPVYNLSMHDISDRSADTLLEVGGNGIYHSSPEVTCQVQRLSALTAGF